MQDHRKLDLNGILGGTASGEGWQLGLAFAGTEGKAVDSAGAGVWTRP